jgi:hypothetical protein
MKRPTYIASFLGVAFVCLGIVACNKSGMGSSTPAVPTCAYGQVYDGISCVTNTLGNLGVPTGSRIGFFAQTSNFPNYNTQGSTMTISPGWQTFLQYNEGVCNRDYINGGLSACGAWMQGFHDMVIMFDGATANEAKLVIRSYPKIDPYMNYTMNIPSFTQFFAGLFGFYAGNMTGVYNPLVLKTTVWPIGGSATVASKGFELRATGPTGSNGWWRNIQFIVSSGKLEDPYFNYNIYVDNGQQQMALGASGRMIRCTTQNCGVPGL